MPYQSKNFIVNFVTILRLIKLIIKDSFKNENNTSIILEGNYGIKKTHLKNAEQKLFICDCGKTFKSKSGLWKHKKKCDFKNRRHN